MIIEKDALPPDLVKMLRNQPNPPIMNIVTGEKALTVSKVNAAIDEYIINSQSKDPEAYEYLQSVRYETEYILTMRVFGLIIVYLKNALLADSTLRFFKYSQIISIA